MIDTFVDQRSAQKSHPVDIVLLLVSWLLGIAPNWLNLASRCGILPGLVRSVVADYIVG